MYQTSLTWVSFASEPDSAKNTFDIGTGAISFSFSASSIAGSWLRPEKRCVEGQLLHLLACAASTSSRLRIAERRAPQAGHALDVVLAVAVEDPDALAALEDQRPGVAEAREVGVGVDQRFDVASGKVREHGRLRVDSNGEGTGSARRGEHARRHIPPQKVSELY